MLTRVEKKKRRSFFSLRLVLMVCCDLPSRSRLLAPSCVSSGTPVPPSRRQERASLLLVYIIGFLGRKATCGYAKFYID